MASSIGDYCRLHFRVKCSARIGQFVGVQGQFSSGEELKAIKLVTTPAAYPIWSTSRPIVVPRGEIVNYKYCLIEDGAVKSAEQNGSNPRIIIPEDGDTVVEDEFNLQPLERRNESEMELLENNSVKRRNTETEKSDWKRIGQSNSRLFLVCYHLPLVVRRTGQVDAPFEVEWAESLIAKSEGSISQTIKTIWIGTLNIPVSELTPSEKEYLVVLLRNMDCIPVFLEDDLANSAYTGYCKRVLWPVFHNVDQLDQIHAAWNMPSELDAAKGLGSSSFGSPKASLNHPLPVSENKVLDWNQKEAEYLEAFKRVNDIFASVILELARDRDVIWVHDYHLMLLPRGLRKAVSNPSLNISGLKTVFFLHIPFPTSQIFRTLPESQELLQAMLCADLIGFHAFDHARHFLNAAKRMIGVRSQTRQGGMLTLSVADREVILAMSHVSIETDRLDALLQHPETQRMANAIREKYHGRRIVLGIDVCQRLSGLSLKVAAFEKLLADRQGAGMGTGLSGEGIVLIQKALRQGSRPEDEETTSQDLSKLVNALNNKCSASSGMVVDFEEPKGLGLQERLALYLAADVFLVTAIREGLNLLPLEFIYARRELSRAGAVVASEFSTVSSLLNGSLKVNPFSADSVAEAVAQALTMGDQEADYRRQRDMPFILAHPSSRWTKQILNELEQLRSQSGHGAVTPGRQPLLLPVRAVKQAYSLIGGGNAHGPATNSSFNEVAASSASSLVPLGSRVFVFDYGGTLLSKEKFDIYLKQSLSAISGRKPSEVTMDALKTLSEDPLNVVIVVTGLTRNKLGDDVFNDLKNVTIATSNGLVYSLGENLRQALRSRKASDSSREYLTPIETEDGRVWEYNKGQIDWTAVTHIAQPIIEKFTFRTNGTCPTPRFPGVGWSYFGADPEWGLKQAAQLKVELEAALAQHDVQVATLIPGSLEIVPMTLQKGNIVTVMLSKILACRADRLPSLITVIGDEAVDDGMFTAVYDLIAQAPPQALLRQLKVFTVTVGKKQSPANYYLNEVQDVESLLKSLVSSN